MRYFVFIFSSGDWSVIQQQDRDLAGYRHTNTQNKARWAFFRFCTCSDNMVKSLCLVDLVPRAFITLVQLFRWTRVPKALGMRLTFSESTITFKMVIHCFASVMYNKACTCDMVIKHTFCLKALEWCTSETVAADCVQWFELFSSCQCASYKWDKYFI